VSHRSHDYPHLIRRWRAVAKRAGIQIEAFASAQDADVFYLRTPALAEAGGVYLSAGIHGDEPASTEALLAWAEKDVRRLAKRPLLIFPCLNPWGLSRNLRTDEKGVDLNRSFDRDDVPVTRAVRGLIAGYRFLAALHLHEDYDGQGLYLYEGLRSLSPWGEKVIAAARRVIAIDPRRRIDVAIARNGVIRRRFSRERYRKLGGLPEAAYLHRFHAERSLTIETPSEFDLWHRVAAHIAVIDECLRLASIAPSR
jgi:hypothetical protein